MLLSLSLSLSFSDAFRILSFERQSEHTAIDRYIRASVTATDYARVSSSEKQMRDAAKNAPLA